jgi:hypothetical protein
MGQSAADAQTQTIIRTVAAHRRMFTAGVAFPANYVARRKAL